MRLRPPGIGSPELHTFNTTVGSPSASNETQAYRSRCWTTLLRRFDKKTPACRALRSVRWRISPASVCGLGNTPPHLNLEGTVLNKDKRAATSLLQPVDLVGGVDGARTRDPRRDRVGDQTSIHAGLRLVCYSKDCRFRAALARHAPVLFQSFHRPDGRTRADGTSKTDLDRSLIERSRRGQDSQSEFPRGVGVVSDG